ncbi:IS200/IS605 family element transposase accessory protein TnpB [Haloferax sp. MBLA0076]|uniref:IS200/IS605 family element transposase accessory protein TnpB n=1 Tax=Haloferax litoreum TaxID=2666140 RepID=A0A6A8GDC9_9EURY|nr:MULTISPECIES: RNA-guided endonuclease TnpB family protein [Haloferax]KAB1192307.1 IS200/IS605 family element transposase accessory protein TnpB [Haloferax sp. CBA1148]MRX20766.1 IS200/IS605 family element transposase accessory protein TnpB [Haloferax litoreum]
MEHIIRTVIVKLDVPDERCDDLHQTKNQFLHCANTTAEWAWRYPNDYCVTSKQKAEKALYEQLRSETELTANLVQKGIRRAIEASKSGVARLKKGENTSQPHFDAWSVVYDKRSATFYRDHVSLSTVNGRVECNYVLPDDPDGTPIGEYLLNEDFEFRMSTLQYDQSTESFYLHARMRRPVRELPMKTSDSKHRTVLGVDVNVDGTLAVTSTGSFIGNANKMNHRRREFETTRGSMQRTGTRSAHLSIQSMKYRERRWMKDELHRVSCEIVSEARGHGCTHIAFENLTDIRTRMAGTKKFHAWAFRRLFEYVEYKAEMLGIAVEQVDPAYTSQRCSKCGFTHKSNRPSKHAFVCRKCGYQSNADYNASKNIARKLMKTLHSEQKSPGGGAPCQCALTSGTLNLHGDFSAYSL